MENKSGLTAAMLVRDILTNPFRIDSCYSLFHNYSILNSLALSFQIQKRGLKVGPCASFKKWSELGGRVNKGEKALFVCVPFQIKDKLHTIKKIVDGVEKEEPGIITLFQWKPCVFTYAQVSGVDEPKMEGLSWDYKKALDKLGIKELPYNSTDGNCQGYATDEGIALNPIGKHKVRTAVHEIAHKLLHTKGTGERNEKEVEAEMTSYIVGLILHLDGVEESRGYIRHWLGMNELTEKTAMKCLATANKILNAGK